jgi:hypothetical protein
MLIMQAADCPLLYTEYLILQFAESHTLKQCFQKFWAKVAEKYIPGADRPI